MSKANGKLVSVFLLSQNLYFETNAFLVYIDIRRGKICINKVTVYPYYIKM